MPSSTSELAALYTDTIIDPSETEIPYKLLRIMNARFEALEAVLDDILALKDLDNLFGQSLEYKAEQWSVYRNGRTDAILLDALKDRIFLYGFSSNIPDMLRVLENFDAPAGSLLIERLPPEDAEVNIRLNGAGAETVSRITQTLNAIKAGGVEIDVYNEVAIGDRLLDEDEAFLVFEDGDYILLEDA